MIATKSLLIKLAKKFPKKIAKKHHDYVGLMVGNLPINISKILVCLDLDEEVLPYVKQYQPDIIFTHHPFIYGSKKQVLKNDKKKQMLVDELEKLNVPVYSFHTNFDEGVDGMNDALIKALGCRNVYAPEEDQMMRIGYLGEEMNIYEFAKLAKRAFLVDYSLLIKGNDKLIKKIAIIGGGGSRSWKIAKDSGADIFISGDAPHHVRRDILTSHYNYLDMPHEIEKIFMPTMKKILLDIDFNLSVICIDHEKLPEVI